MSCVYWDYVLILYSSNQSCLENQDENQSTIFNRRQLSFQNDGRFLFVTHNSIHYHLPLQIEEMCNSRCWFLSRNSTIRIGIYYCIQKGGNFKQQTILHNLQAQDFIFIVIGTNFLNIEIVLLKHFLQITFTYLIFLAAFIINLYLTPNFRG